MAPPTFPPAASPFHAFVARRTGMALSELQCRRLDEKLTARPGGLSAQYLMHLQSPAGAADLAELIDAISVQKTELFRDESQLAALRMHVLEPMVARMRRPLRLWSAGCATGEEVATLLVLLAEVGADPDSTVLGTDISETAIARARELCFSAEQFQRVPSGMRERWFLPAPGGRFTLVGHLKERASFECHNLMDLPYPVAAEGQGFDIIVCRNVLIYFTPESFDRVVASLAVRLAPEGMLVLSAAEPLLRAPPSLRTQRFEQAFFYARAPQGTAITEAVLPGPVMRPSSSGLPAVGASPKASELTVSGRFPAVASPKVATPAEVRPGEAGAHTEADALFAQVLEWASAGGEASPQTAEALRRCLMLDPDLSAARYLLGMLLEQRGSLTESAAEYRRALRSLEEGRARATPFFLNNARLQVACARAIERVERAAGPDPVR
ncbi:CheR family methyltransferase [Archangium lansingense]|uniref:Protein-glutamate O-methyltransferase CheR n=1 Tax=Archangium lansingense TaxID=2995310 RepID=A0ABT4AF03_9BACT|nr:protein-glutamate O-methyltransferase CheR [Archangium lansinium]MCY1080262.1 protein-glutamate O-methyltransferase CheR [Archangium lansinium]